MAFIKMLHVGTVLAVLLLAVAAQSASGEDRQGSNAQNSRKERQRAEDRRSSNSKNSRKEKQSRGDRRENDSTNMGLVVPPSEIPYEHATLDWWRWALEPVNFTFAVDTCAGNQKYFLPNYAPVFFLAGVGFSGEDIPSVDVTRETNCFVPDDAYLMIPAINSASALDPNNETEVETLSDKKTKTRNSTLYLLDQDIPSWLVSHSLEVDGKVVTTNSYTILSELETFSAPGAGILNYPGQSYGRWNLLRPLSPGRHEVRICSSIDADKDKPGLFRFCVTYKLTVGRKK
jgi:hypothetical protein